MKKTYNVCYPEEWTNDHGELRTQYHSIGRAFSGTSKSGVEFISVKIGVPISCPSSLVLFPVTDKEEQDDKTA